jgi:hypothetical protein
MFVLFPAACRLVGVSVGTAIRQAVWPVLWPLPVMIAVVSGLRTVLPMSLPVVVLTAATGALCYAAVFITFAVGRTERAEYLARIRAATRWREPLPPREISRSGQSV